MKIIIALFMPIILSFCILENCLANGHTTDSAQSDQSVMQAQRLRDEGYALQRQNRINEAVAKYRESLAYLPDPQLEKHISQLESVSAGQRQTVQPQVQQPYAPQVPVSQPSATSQGSPGLDTVGQTLDKTKDMLDVFKRAGEVVNR